MQCFLNRQIRFILAGKPHQLTAGFQGGPMSQVQVQEYSVQHRRNKSENKTHLQEATCVQKRKL